MPKMTVVKEITFEAAHHLPNTGKCSNLHGHSYKLQVGVEGEVVNGMVMNFADLKEMLYEIHDQFDHANTNDLIKFPSAENMVKFIWDELTVKLARYPGVKELKIIRLWETATSYVEYGD